MQTLVLYDLTEPNRIEFFETWNILFTNSPTDANIAILNNHVSIFLMKNNLGINQDKKQKKNLLQNSIRIDFKKIVWHQEIDNESFQGNQQTSQYFAPIFIIKQKYLDECFYMFSTIISHIFSSKKLQKILYDTV